MSDYTPDTSDVKAAYVRAENPHAYYSDDYRETCKQLREQFDRWLAEHDRQVREADR